ncbi:hypothetical protein CDD83_1768 [Cordyceps sp. RAO-2017]|nr:hypothetical protein CDD83_1768 [Cordyceps sp. RAO-2017]
MRFLKVENNGDIALAQDIADQHPPYAILSHTWGRDEDEVTFKDIVKGRASQKAGYRKLRFCGEQAASDGLKYFWVDSCCIDKANSTELSVAINSMFRWYQNATKCYVFLSDVRQGGTQGENRFSPHHSLRGSRWFTRAWTLQELLAPSSVEFFSFEGQILGNKKSLEYTIHQITDVPVEALRGSPLSDFGKCERMEWARNRTAKIEEDKAYSLLGIFGVHMPLIYGEGAKAAFIRLNDVIDRRWAFERGMPHGRQNRLVAGFGSTRSIRIGSMAEAERNTTDSLEGKPGTGKSILVNEAFCQAAQLPDCCTAAFFFNAKGDNLERSPLGLFRSLLYQLLPKHPEHLEQFRSMWNRRNNGGAGNGPEWREHELRSFFESMFKLPVRRRTVIFIDGLDECDSESARSHAYFWRFISKYSYCARTHLSVCLSRRSFPEVTLSDCPEILMENHNEGDIAIHVEQKLKMAIAPTEPKWPLIRDILVEKSSGVFLWVSLAVDELLRGWDEGRDVECLLKKLDTVPRELKVLYSQMLSGGQVPPDEKRLTARVFQWAILGVRALRLHEWHHIMAFVREPAPSSLLEWRRSNDFTRNDDQLEKRIRTLSRGLLEVKTRSDRNNKGSNSKTTSVCAGAGSFNLECGETRVIQVIHESVRDFFLQESGFSVLDPTLEQDAVGKSHLAIMGTCLDYLNITELDALVLARLIAKRDEADDSSEEQRPEATDTALSQLSSDGLTDASRPQIHRSRGARFLPTEMSPHHSTLGEGGDVKRRRLHARDGQPRREEWNVPAWEVPEDPSDSARHNDILLWLEKSTTDRPPAGHVSPDHGGIHAYTCYSPMARSTAGRSQVLEDYPALLSYALFELFTHAGEAERTTASLDHIVGRLMTEQTWARWVALRDDLPAGINLHVHAMNCKLHRWSQAWIGTFLHLEASSQPENLTWQGQEVLRLHEVSEKEHEGDRPRVARSRGSSSVASFSSAASHAGDMKRIWT